MRRVLIIFAAFAAMPAAAHAQAPAAAGPANFDVRAGDDAQRPASRVAGQRRLKRALGPGGTVRIARRTGAPSLVTRRGGFLTGRRRGTARALAIAYLRRNAAAFGLDRDDLASLRVHSSYITPRGLRHVELRQFRNGIPSFDNVLRVNVQGGRLVSLSGTLKPDLAAPSTSPGLSASAANRRAADDVGVRPSVPAGHSDLVLFAGAERTRLAWSVLVLAGPGRAYRSVIDADTGRVLKRTNLAAHATVRAFDHLPAAADGGGTPRTASTAGADPWLTGTLQRLRGDNAWTYADPDDDTYIGCDDLGCFAQAKVNPVAEQEVAPSSDGGTTGATWDYPQVTDAESGAHTCPATGCTWNSASLTAPFTAGNNWQANRNQAAAQLFYFVNNFHDHLQADAGIQFDDASGNFEESSDIGTVGGDAVRAQVDDGAATQSANFPDGDHLNNANMITLPELDVDGDPEPYRAPQMQMYLFGGSANDVNGADDAEIVYHEYVHGLSTRLVDPADGQGLSTAQGGAMGEAWSDWYAADYLDEKGFQTDQPGVPDMFAGQYEDVEFREQPMDCTVGSPVRPACGPGGGFTYADFANVIGFPEVHADGEIWAQTLWDLRRTLIAAHGRGPGIFRARALVTDAMRIAPAAPTFIDMRDAILTASSLSAFGDCARIWDVFAARGMGSGAQASGPEDTTPTASFADPGASACSPGGPGTTAPPATRPPSPLVPAKATFTGFPKTIRVDRRGRFRLRFRGPARVSGDLALRSVSRVRVSAKRRVTFANRAFKVPATGRVSILVKLSKRNHRVLRRNKRIRTRLAVVLSTSSGSSRATRTFTLRRR